jgi:hypothetical protein
MIHVETKFHPWPESERHYGYGFMRYTRPSNEEYSQITIEKAQRQPRWVIVGGFIPYPVGP